MEAEEEEEEEVLTASFLDARSPATESPVGVLMSSAVVLMPKYTWQVSLLQMSILIAYCTLSVTVITVYITYVYTGDVSVFEVVFSCIPLQNGCTTSACNHQRTHSLYRLVPR